VDDTGKAGVIGLKKVKVKIPYTLLCFSGRGMLRIELVFAFIAV
jgi:hypothetical protein